MRALPAEYFLRKPSLSPEDGMTTLEHWFEEVWNQGREAAIDELMSPNTKGHGLRGPDGNEIDGMAAFKSFHKTFRSAFPDIHIKVEDTVTEGDKTVARCVVTGRHTGGSLGKTPTGKPVKFTGMCMVRVKDGKIIESWNNFDFMAMYQQME
jgi:predicted ester cyclase